MRVEACPIVFTVISADVNVQGERRRSNVITGSQGNSEYY